MKLIQPTFLLYRFLSRTVREVFDVDQCKSVPILKANTNEKPILRLMLWCKEQLTQRNMHSIFCVFTNILLMVLKSSIVWSLSWVSTAYEFLLHSDNCILLDFTSAMSFYHADHADMTSSPPSSGVCHLSAMFSQWLQHCWKLNSKEAGWGRPSPA